LYRNAFLKHKNQPIRELYVCHVINKDAKGAAKKFALPVMFSLADHEFIWA